MSQIHFLLAIVTISLALSRDFKCCAVNRKIERDDQRYAAMFYSCRNVAECFLIWSFDVGGKSELCEFLIRVELTALLLCLPMNSKISEKPREKSPARFFLKNIFNTNPKSYFSSRAAALSGLETTRCHQALLKMKWIRPSDS